MRAIQRLRIRNVAYWNGERAFNHNVRGHSICCTINDTGQRNLRSAVSSFLERGFQHAVLHRIDGQQARGHIAGNLPRFADSHRALRQ